jgi:HTH-type transcriptional regulator/antitoxin MqsA
MVHDTRDMPYTFESEILVMPSVTADFCPDCSETILDADESTRVSAVMLGAPPQ